MRLASNGPATASGDCCESQSATTVVSSPWGSVMGLSVLRSAGDVDDLARHEPGPLADEERRGVGDVLGLTDPLHRDLVGAELDEVVEVDLHAGGRRGGHVGLDEAGRDGVGGDAELAEL